MKAFLSEMDWWIKLGYTFFYDKVDYLRTHFDGGETSNLAI